MSPCRVSRLPGKKIRTEYMLWFMLALHSTRPRSLHTGVEHGHQLLVKLIVVSMAGCGRIVHSWFMLGRHACTAQQGTVRLMLGCALLCRVHYACHAHSPTHSSTQLTATLHSKCIIVAGRLFRGFLTGSPRVSATLQYGVATSSRVNGHAPLQLSAAVS